jgi:hypothetical protein
MTRKEKARPHATPEAVRAAREREERLAAALRANLARRKAQARQREAPPPPEKKA